MDALIVIDMQCVMLDGGPKHDLAGVVERINRLAVAVRGRSGRVVWIQHSGRPGETTVPGSPGWRLLPELKRDGADAIVPKTLNDPFAGTALNLTLRETGVDRLLICGWATDFCVDAGVRSAVSGGYHVVPVGDAHTVGDRPHMDAAAVIVHHNWLWANLIPSRSIAVIAAAELLG